MARSAHPDRFLIAARRIFDGEAMHGPGAVEITEGRIAAIHAEGRFPSGLAVEMLPGEALLAPGLVDLQVNGGGGAFLNERPDAGGVAAIAAAHLRHGTTSLLPTLITDAPAKMRRLAADATGAMQVPGILGFHLEGPFLSLQRKGIHPPEHVRPPAPDDLALLLQFAAHGRSLVTLAPECVPPEFIARLAAAGITVSIGHSEATCAEVEAAERQGARMVTHLFNAMSPLQGRAPGIVGAALASGVLTAGIIADGIHVDPANVRAAWRAMGPERLFLVSDAMPTAASASTGFHIGERWIALSDGRLTDSAGTLGGCNITLAEAVRGAVRLAGLPLTDALRMATATPADAIGAADRAGRIRPGLPADLVALDGDCSVQAVWQNGVRISQVGS